MKGWEFRFGIKVKNNKVVVSNIFCFHPYLGKWSNLTNIFQRGWNHQLDNSCMNLYEIMYSPYWLYICIKWVFPKRMVPPNHPFQKRVFHYFHHLFWGSPIFGNIHISFSTFTYVDTCLLHGRFELDSPSGELMFFSLEKSRMNLPVGICILKSTLPTLIADGRCFCTLNL